MLVSVQICSWWISFCYLGDMLGVDGDAGVAVEAKVQIGWVGSNNNNLVYIAPVCQTDFGSALGQSQLCVPVTKPKCLTKIVSL